MFHSVILLSLVEKWLPCNYVMQSDSHEGMYHIYKYIFMNIYTHKLEIVFSFLKAIELS